MKTLPVPNHTQVPNVILDNLAKLTPAELKVLLVVVRATFGWHKDRDMLSLSQISEKSGLTRRYVQDLVKRLDGNWLIRIPHEDSFTYQLNLAGRELSSPVEGSGRELSSLEVGNSVLPQKKDSKKVNTIQDILSVLSEAESARTPEVRAALECAKHLDPPEQEAVLLYWSNRLDAIAVHKYAPDSWQRQFAARLHGIIKERGRFPDSVEKRVGEENLLQDAAATLDQLHRIDGESVEDISAVLDYAATGDDFWIPKGALRTGTSLRARSLKTQMTKYEMLKDNMTRGSSPSTPSFW